MTLEPKVMISFTYTQPAQAVPGIAEYIPQKFYKQN